MKDFVKTMLAVIAGFIVIRVIGFIFMIAIFGSAMAAGVGGSVAIPRNGGVLDMDMSAFTLTEQAGQDELSSLTSFSSMLPSVGMRDAVQALRIAATDPSISYVLLRADAMSAGMSDVEELRAALLFRRLAEVGETPAGRRGTRHRAAVRGFASKTK